MQALQADHEPTTQFTGQLCVLHAWDCIKAGHATPPLAVATTTERVCVWVPPPQVAVHVDQLDQPLTMQCTGHACVLQRTLCVRAGHALPPCAAAVSMERLCDWVPPPQLVEHADIGPHALTTQSTGQACKLHD